MNLHRIGWMTLACLILACVILSSSGPCAIDASHDPAKTGALIRSSSALEKVIACNKRDQYDSALLILRALESSAKATKDFFPVYLQFCETYSYKKDHELSLIYLEKARTLATCRDDDETQMDLSLAEADHFFHKGYYNQALEKLHTLKRSPVLSLASVVSLKKLQYSLARCYFSAGGYDSALHYYNLVLHHASVDLFQKAKIYDAIGIMYAKKADYITAEKYFRNSLAIKTDSIPPDDEAISYSYNVLGLSCWRRGGAYAEALNYLNRSADLRKKKLGVHGLVSDCYNNMGLIYREMGQYHKAIEYLKAALDIRLEFYGPSLHPEIGGSYNNIGLAYMNQADYVEARAYLLKALAVKRKFLGEKHQSVAHSLNNLGTVHSFLKNYDSAHLYLAKALTIHLQILRTGNPDVADIHKELAVLALQFKRDLVGAKKHYAQALAIRNAIHGNNHQAIAAIYNDLANACDVMGEYKQALAYAQQSMQTNKVFEATVESKDSLRPGYANLIEYFRSHKRMSQAYWGLYQKTADIDFLYKAFQPLQVCDSLSRDYRRYATDREDEFYYGSEFGDVYDGLVKMCYLLHQETKKDEYLQLAFSYSEKGRAVVLRGMLSNAEAKQKVSLPQNLVLRERELKNEISTQRSLLRRQESADDEVLQSRHRYLLLETNRKLDGLIDSIEQMYPRYYRLKYAEDAISIEHLQKNLQADQAVIEYAIIDTILYSFVITQNKVSFSNQSYSLENVYAAQEILAKLGAYPRKPEKIYNDFVTVYYNLYESLLVLPLKSIPEQDSIKHLIIIPSKELNYIPFELLLTDNATGTPGAYGKLPYLLNDFAISYAHSVSVMLHQKQVSQHHIPVKTYAGFAPRYNGHTSDSLHPERNTDAGLKHLKWNAKEVEQIAARTSSDYFIADEATEANFKRKVNDYSIVHLAMHASVNDRDPMNSMLVFSQVHDAREDGLLYIHELLGMELFPELVVLSACNTGVGKLKKGEGVMSLAYGFTSAGCRSAVVSHWQVDDGSTHRLMRLFFDNLLKGDDKHKALRAAKHSYLEDADPLHANPIYWAGFVLVGDWQPVTVLANKPNYVLIISLFTLTAIIALVYWLVRK
jgi:CHAT domain-containing protein/tetratricopeptide (TPR) repeat protein